MFQEEIKDSVRQAYSAITTGGGEAVARRFYTDDELAEVPSGAAGLSLSVGNPVRYAFLRQGETVLDVGSGGGIDTILAARHVGPEGRAVGLDILEEMCERGADVHPRSHMHPRRDFRQSSRFVPLDRRELVCRTHSLQAPE
jgi:SAM-dependent methyltransferase